MRWSDESGMKWWVFHQQNVSNLEKKRENKKQVFRFWTLSLNKTRIWTRNLRQIIYSSRNAFPSFSYANNSTYFELCALLCYTLYHTFISNFYKVFQWMQYILLLISSNKTSPFSFFYYLLNMSFIEVQRLSPESETKHTFVIKFRWQFSQTISLS